MAEWASDKILGSSFITHSTSNGYEIHFATPEREKYLAVQEECRRQIDHAKPLTNADKFFRNATDEELAKIIVRAKYFDKFCEIVLAGENPGFCDDDCNECALDWLKQEVESDG